MLVGKRQTAICAHANLRLVGIDENLWMSQWSTTSITLYNPRVCPSYWLLVNQADSCLRSWLKFHNRLLKPWSCHGLRPRILTSRPNGCPIWRLRDPQLLSILYSLLNTRILMWCLNWKLIRLRYILDLLRRVGIVDLLLVVCGEGISPSRRRLCPS